jgi:hypothetical protein
MRCPFSDKVCEECAIYRGRHYFLCYSKKYRGHIDSEHRNKVNKSFSVNTKVEFDIPLKVPVSAIDPFINNNRKHPLSN